MKSKKKGYLESIHANAIYKKSKALGLFAMNMPIEFGGGGLTNLDRILCEEQFGRTTDILIRRAFGNVYEPLLHCKKDQVERWLKPSVEGKRTCAICITEPGAGSDAAGIKTHAKKTIKDGCSMGLSTSSAMVSGVTSFSVGQDW
jgi:acyl-CoA dehydrogenase